MTRRIVIALERADAPVTGSIESDGETYAFSGWLGLLTGLDRALRDDGPDGRDGRRGTAAGAVLREEMGT